MDTDNKGLAGRIGEPNGLSQAEPEDVSALRASIPCAWLDRIFSERVILACDAAKAVPGDVWGKGAEGHYAFLCGLAAFLDLQSEDLNRMIDEARKRREWFDAEHPEVVITGRCPDRVLADLGFAQAMSAGTDETVQPAQGDSPPARS